MSSPRDIDQSDKGEYGNAEGPDEHEDCKRTEFPPREPVALYAYLAEQMGVRNHLKIGCDSSRLGQHDQCDTKSLR